MSDVVAPQGNAFDENDRGSVRLGVFGPWVLWVKSDLEPGEIQASQDTTGRPVARAAIA
jgi:hypothetical protein